MLRPVHGSNPARSGRPGVSTSAGSDPQRGVTLATLADLEQIRDEIIEALEELRAPTLPTLLDREACAAWLGVSVRTVDKMRADGAPVVFVGDSPRFEPERLLGWMKSRAG